MPEEQQEGQEQQGGGGKKIVIIAIVGALVVGGGAAAAVALMMGGGGGEKKAQAASPPPAPAPVAAPVAPQTEGGLPVGPPKGPLVPFDTIIVNLNEPGGTRYLKVTFQVELSSKALAKEIEKMKIPIRDALIEYLSSLTLSETQSIEAKRKIKLEIIQRMNRFLTSGRVINIYFTEFVVQ